MTGNPIIELSDVTFSYGCHPVLENVSLTVFPGESVGVTGPNGAGKTTLLRLILGQLKPVSGTISIFGSNAGKFKKYDKISFVSQKATSFNSGFPITVEETVATGRITGRKIFRPLDAEDRKHVHRALEQVGLGEYKRQLLSSLSGGQQQRVFIARALAREPDLLLLDEPASGLDRAAQEQLYDLLKQLVFEQGLTLIMVSHELGDISPVISRLVCLNRNLCTCSCHSLQRPEALDYCSRRLWSA